MQNISLRYHRGNLEQRSADSHKSEQPGCFPPKYGSGGTIRV